MKKTFAAQPPSFADRLGLESLEDHLHNLNLADDAYLTSDRNGNLAFTGMYVANSVAGAQSYSGASLTGAVAKN